MHGSPLSVLLLDLDRFKLINDTHGHDEGDRALRRVAMLIDRSKRETGLVRSWGGEEFLLVAPGLDLEHAIGAADRLRRMVEQSGEHGGVRVTASFGVNEYALGEDLTSLVKRADEGLMLAREGGRNRVSAAAA